MASSYARNIAAAVVLLGALAVIGLAYRFLVQPELEGQLIAETSGSSQYDEVVTLRLDGFSGYAPIRSQRFKELLRADGIRADLVDDQADYADRIRALDRRKADMAVFTIDAFVLAGYDLGRFPGAIVAVLDETAGADAIVAYEDAVPDLKSLDDPRASLVLTPASPSEFLGRVAVAEFGLKELSPRVWKHADGAEDVLKQLKAADKTARQGFVLWEPQVSQALQLPGVHTLFDSSQVSGYIVDVLVAERTMLRDRPETVGRVVAAWLSTLYETVEADGLDELVADDARLDASLARTVTAGIRWRNTLDNYAYFGLVPTDRAAGVVNLEDAIANIAGVLERTRATPTDPVGEDVTPLFYPGVLQGLMDADFHPAEAGGGSGGTRDLQASAGALSLEPLAADAWDQLVGVGSMSVRDISFGRGRATIHVQGRRELDQLARRLRSLPTFYLTVIGQARAEGDPEANRALAAERAEAVRAHLVAAGVARQRVRAMPAPPIDAGGAAQTVRFELGQRAY